ncbi:MAG: BppU family phage baseplate upper protein, partial [Clostridium perfringens]|nr:BppU family phage baseplate upper protein [Clostridium perfringens]
MAKKNLKVKVDTINGLYKPEGTIKQLDSVFFNIEVTEEGEKKDLTGQTIKLFARKSDGKMVEQSSGISITNAEQGELTIDLLNAAVQAPGYVYFELEISDSNGIISTADFVYRVIPKVGSDEAIESTNEVSTLKEIEVYVAQAKQEIKK